MSHAIGFLTCLLQNKAYCKPIVDHGVKVDRLSSVCWKDILDVHCTDRVTPASKKIILTVNVKR